MSAIRACGAGKGEHLVTHLAVAEINQGGRGGLQAG
jgi:hypothetical protein